MSLPWFKARTAQTVAGMMKHAWTNEYPCPEYLAEIELQALTASGQRDEWSIRDLSVRWCWSKSRTHRWILSVGQCLASSWDGTHLESQGLTAPTETKVGQKWDASRAQLNTREKEKEKEKQQQPPPTPPGGDGVPGWVPSGKPIGLTKDQVWKATLEMQDKLLKDYQQRCGPRSGPRSWSGRIKGRGRNTRQRALANLLVAEGVEGTLQAWEFYLTQRLDKGYGGDGIDTFLEKGETYASKTREQTPKPQRQNGASFLDLARQEYEPNTYETQEVRRVVND